MIIYTGLIKDLGCRCFYYDSGMNIPIANNDNIELVLRMAKLSDKLNMMNIDDYYESYISFVMSRFNGIMDSYDVYNSISVDDVRDMVKDITEDKLIIQYCS